MREFLCALLKVNAKWKIFYEYLDTRRKLLFNPRSRFKTKNWEENRTREENERLFGGDGRKICGGGCEWATLREKEEMFTRKIVVQSPWERKNSFSDKKKEKNRCKVEQTWQWIYYEKKDDVREKKSSSNSFFLSCVTFFRFFDALRPIN